MKFTKLTSVALLSATLLTTVVACSKQNDTATTTQKSVTSSKVTHNSESAVSKQSRKDNIQIKLSQQEAIDKFNQQFNNKKIHSEKFDHDDRNQKALALRGAISRDDASRIAEEHVKGTREEWKLEQDEDTGKTYWDVTVKNGHQETDVKINAHTREIISTEHDD